MDATAERKTPDPVWMTKAEAAERLRVDPATIDRWVARDLLPKHNLPGSHHVRFRTEDVDAVLVPATAPATAADSGEEGDDEWDW